LETRHRAFFSLGLNLVAAFFGFPDVLNPNPAFEKSRFVREGMRTVVV
jgi:hypothetical protein